MIIGIWLGSRLVLLLLASILAGLIPNQQPMGVLDRFTRWDGGWYRSIAEHGYELRGPDQQSNLAFFPLYPILGRVASILFLRNSQSGLLLISNLAFLVALIYVYRLGRLEFDAESGRRALIYMALFPFAVFFAALYSESLFVALAAAAFFYARQRNWPAALGLGALLPVTRVMGLAIIPALLWEWWQDRRQHGDRSLAALFDRRALALGVLVVPLALFMLFLWWRFGDPLAFSTLVQKNWDRRTTLPWGTIAIGLDVLARLPDSRYVKAIAWLDMGTIGLVLAMLPLVWRRLGVSYTLFVVTVFFLATFTSLDPAKGLPTASIGRYLMTAFPVFLVLGDLGRRRWLHYPVLTLFAALFGPVAIYYFATIWVG
ncbi:MAG: mannosyltransferase family protein [Ardenticatenaceae bacterium]|nr:mannosyltransferase family protein [Ardenticatenaceae bacterium]